MYLPRSICLKKEDQGWHSGCKTILPPLCQEFDSHSLLKKIPNFLPFFTRNLSLPVIYIFYIGVRSHENAPYMRNENESQPHDMIRVTTLVH